MTTWPGTSLEYTATTGAGAPQSLQVYVHSARSGAAETRGTWRQPHTQRDLRPGARAQYGFRLQWASRTVRTIDDPDIFVDRMVYALTADDPGLAKAPFLASKNVSFPDRQEIESLEYYIKHFVWGGLQRRDDERPYPYGVYGTPHWFINRDPARRKAYAESLANGATALRDLSREHVWRSYDYPHVVMLYFHM